MTRAGGPASRPPDAARALEKAARAHWSARDRGGSPPPRISAARKAATYEVTASSKGRSATLRLSARFVDRLLEDPDASCRRCAGRFFEKLFERLGPLPPISSSDRRTP